MLISQERFERIYRENQVKITCLVLILNNDCNADWRGLHCSPRVQKSAVQGYL